jgi:hypothetical protein
MRMTLTLSPWRVLVALGFATLLLATLFVASAQASPTPGASCARAGRERVTTVGTLRCVAMSSGRTRWRLISPPSSPTTPTTVTTTPTTRAPQVSDISADDSRVRFTLSAMSPDTGNYAVQWIERGASFARYDMVRVTSRNVALSTDAFRCDRTYTMRVFVMRADWTGDRGHTNENVTPHSDLFDVTMRHSCGGSLTPVADTCADGGTCVVGDTGPGGGIIFYVHPSGTFTSTGSDCGANCKYLEAARSDQSAGVAWCSDTTTALAVTSQPIGSGMSNTTTADTRCSSGAFRVAADYSNNGKTDWHLPSADELNALYLQRVAVGGFAPAFYWNSSEFSATLARVQSFANGSVGDANKTDLRPVRVVRAVIIPA